MKRYFILMLAVLMFAIAACSGEPSPGVGAENVGRDIPKGCSQEVVESPALTITGTVDEIRTVTSSNNYTLLSVIGPSPRNNDHYFGIWGTKISKFLNEGDKVQVVAYKWEDLYEVCGDKRELVERKPVKANTLVITDEAQRNPGGSITFTEVKWTKVELTDITIFPKPTPPKTITISK